MLAVVPAGQHGGAGAGHPGPGAVSRGSLPASSTLALKGFRRPRKGSDKASTSHVQWRGTILPSLPLAPFAWALAPRTYPAQAPEPG